MGLFSGVGKILNDITGATSSAKQAQNYALQQMAISNQYSKEFAQNAHQWETADLQKAGLNRILSANGGGASASGGQIGGAGTPTSGISPIDIITSLASAKNLITDSSLKEAQELKTLTENGLLPKQTAQNIAESKAREKYTNERARGYSSTESYSSSNQYNDTEEVGGGGGGGGLTFHAEHNTSRKTAKGSTKSSSKTISRTW